MPEEKLLLLGTHFHPGGAAALKRQQECRDAFLKLRGATGVNLQFPDSIQEVDGFETAPELLTDSIKTACRRGPRKPVLSEAFHCLARKAHRKGIPYFGWTNSDILISQEVLDLIAKREHDCTIFTRMDFERDASGGIHDIGMFLGGQDLFVYSTDWWERHGHRFRPYVVGEAYFDNVYTSIALCHGDTMLVNREPLIRHENHPRLWTQSPFAQYNRHLASLDTPYLNRWTRYKEALKALQERKSGAAEYASLLKSSFGEPGFPERLWHLGRCLKSWGRFRLQQFDYTRKAGKPEPGCA